MTLTNEDLLAVSKVLDVKLQPINSGIEEVKELKAEVAELRTEVTEVKEEVAELKTEVTEVKTEVEELRKKVTITNLEIENCIRPQIQLLAENYVPAAKRYERASAYMEEMQDDIALMKKVITEHSETLQRLA